jgi:UDP-N-acetylglucosamine acyltransferase
MTLRAAIDPSAVVSPAARLADDVEVGPFVIVEEDVTIGSGTVLLAGSVIHSGSRIGSGCRIGPYAVLGGQPMDGAFRGEPSLVVLGDRVGVREFATVHRATGEGNATRVGDDTLIMSYAHVSHNVQVGAGCTLTTAVQLGGHCQVGDRAFLGSTAILHQYCRVGPYAMYGAGSASNQDVLPYTMARGNPARHYRLNRVGLQRNGIDGERYRALERAVRALRRRDRAAFEELADASEEVGLMRRFIADSRRGITRFVRSD